MDGNRSLLSLTIGGGWPTKARNAALKLHGAYEDESAGVLLLTHIKDIFNRDGADKVSSDDKVSSAILLKALVAEEQGPWGDWWGSDVEADKTRGPASKLARMLKPYGIKPKTVRMVAGTIKGYEKDQFKDAWERYLTLPLPLDTGNRGNTVTTQVDTTVLPKQSKSEIPENKGSEQGCDAVTLKTAIQTEQGEDPDTGEYNGRTYSIPIKESE